MWEYLYDSEGKLFGLDKVAMKDILVCHTDPRRMTEDFRLVLNDLNKLPFNSLGVAAAVINCDDQNDHRKFLKRNSLVGSCFLLRDPTKKVPQ